MKLNCIYPDPGQSLYAGNNHNIVVADTPEYALKGQITKGARILIFAKPPSGFSIDLIRQTISETYCYLIPAGHFHYISPSCKTSFLCIDFEPQFWGSEIQEMLLLFKTVQQKILPFQHHQFYSYNNLKHYALNNPDTYDLLHQLKQDFLQNNTRFIHMKQKQPGYFDLCIRFLKLVDAQEAKLKYCTVNYITDLLSCSERQLYRACDSILGMSAKNILQQIIGLNCLYLLSQNGTSLSMIADEIGFSDAGAMSKFIKRTTGYTPNKIRKNVAL